MCSAIGDVECNSSEGRNVLVGVLIYNFKHLRALCIFLLNWKIHLLWCFHFSSPPLHFFHFTLHHHPKLHGWISPDKPLLKRAEREWWHKMGWRIQSEMGTPNGSSPKAICYSLYYLFNFFASLITCISMVCNILVLQEGWSLAKVTKDTIWNGQSKFLLKLAGFV